MAENDVSVESIELALLSGIEMSSALMMKDAYLPDSPGKADGEPGAPGVQPGDSSPEDGLTGPNAQVYITKLSSRTPDEEIEEILKKYPDAGKKMGTHDFYTVVLAVSMRLSDPSTTRLLNGSIEIVLPREIKILTYSPKEKGAVSALIEKGGNAISIARNLKFVSSADQDTKTQPDPQENRFGILVGPGEKIPGSFSSKNGYSLAIPARALLEYRGMLKNEHEMFWEIYPPMPPLDIDFTGKEMQVVFSFIVQAPKKMHLIITAHIEGKVKGMLWGVVPIKGSAVFK